MAETITWVGGGADNKWSTSENWDLDRLPTHNDIVIFGAGSGDATIDADAVIPNYINSTNRGIMLRMSSGYTGTISMTPLGESVPIRELGLTELILSGGTLDLNGHTLVLNYQVVTGTSLKGNLIDGGTLISDGGTIFANSLSLESGNFNLANSKVIFDGRGSSSAFSINTYRCSGDFLDITGANELIVSRSTSPQRSVVFSSYDTPGLEPCTYNIKYATSSSDDPNYDDDYVDGRFLITIANNSNVIVDGPTKVESILQNAGEYTAGIGEFTMFSGAYDLTLNSGFNLSQATKIQVQRDLTIAADSNIAFNGTDIIFGRNFTLEGAITGADSKNFIMGPLDEAGLSLANVTIIPALIPGNLIMQREDASQNTYWQMSNDTTINGDFIIEETTKGYVRNPTSEHTLTVRGNVSIDLPNSSNRSGGNNMILRLDGANEQTMSMGEDTRNLWDSEIVFDSDTGVFLTNHVATTSTCTLSSGYLNLNGFNLECNGGFTVDSGATLIVDGDETVTDLSFSPGAIIEVQGDGDGASDTYTFGSGSGVISDLSSPTTTLIVNLTDEEDTVQLDTALDLSTDLTVSGGTLDLNGNNVNLGGDLNIRASGTLTVVDEAFVLDGTGQTLSGDFTLYDLSKTVESADTLTFTAGDTVTVSNSLTLTGVVDELLSIRSSSDGVLANLVAPALSTVEFLDVKDNNAADGEALQCTTGCINSTNNFGWIFSVGGGGDRTPPKIVQFSSGGGGGSSEREVEPDEKIAITFDEIIYFNTGNVYLYKVVEDGEDELVEEFYVHGDGVEWTQTNTVYVIPSDPLEPGETYYLLTDRGVFKDFRGNLFPTIDDPESFRFVAAGGSSEENGGVLEDSEEVLPDGMDEISAEEAEELGLPFLDISGHPNQAAIVALYEAGVVEGYQGENGPVFRPNRSLNRAEFLKITLLALAPEEVEAAEENLEDYQNCFPDVREQWFAVYVCLAQEMGVVAGYPDGRFKADRSVNLVEALKMVLELTEANLLSVAPSLPWYTPYLNKAEELGLLENLSSILPATEITRGDMAELTNQFE